jgi:hypothetical protein
MKTNEVHEHIQPSENDYRRFASAVAGRSLGDSEALPLTTLFFHFALPTWGIYGSVDLPSDGASLDALPGIERGTAGVMGLGQSIEIVAPIQRGERIERTSRCVSDETKEGRSGTFRLVTVEREITGERGLLARQRESYAIRGGTT